MSKISGAASNIEIKTNQVISNSTPSNSWTDTEYISAKTLTNAFGSLINTAHPIGSFYETSDPSFNPNTSWANHGQSWELVSSVPDYIYLSSQIMHPGTSGSSGRVAKTNLCGAYNTYLFDYFSYGFERTGYHTEFKFTAVVTTNNANPVHFYLNDVDLGSMTTWSTPAFRRLWTSDFIKLADVTQTPAAGYTSVGYTLAYEVITDVAWHTFEFWDLTAHAYLVSDTPVYKWKRIC